MDNNTKTIGPMMLTDDDYWELPVIGLLCGDAVRERFNIPKTATKLWITITKCRPKHPDAIRVRYDDVGATRLDDDIEADYYIVSSMRKKVAGFGNDFYATLHYA